MKHVMEILLTPALNFAVLLGSALFLSNIFFAPFVHAQDSLLKSRNQSLPVVRSSVLPAEKAFALNVLVEAPETVVFYWEIKEGYYLYQQSISVTDSQGKLILIGELPKSILVTDEFFGEVQVYYNRLLHRFPLASLELDNNSAELTLQYQGCAEDLYCYPLQTKQIFVSLPE